MGLCFGCCSDCTGQKMAVNFLPMSAVASLVALRAATWRPGRQRRTKVFAKHLQAA